MTDTWNRKRGARTTECIKCGGTDLGKGKRECKRCLADAEKLRRVAYFEKHAANPGVCSVADCGELRYVLPSQVSSYCVKHHKQARQRARLKNLYDLSMDDYLALMERAGDACENHACRSTVKPCVDHCHESGAVRGILCDDCNVALGLLADSPERIIGLALYLEAYLRRTLAA